MSCVSFRSGYSGLPVVKTGHWFLSPLHFFGLVPHQGLHGWLHEIRLCGRNSKTWGLLRTMVMHQHTPATDSRTKAHHSTSHHINPSCGRPPKTASKSERKAPRVGIFLFQTNHVVIQNLYRSSSSIFPSIYFIQAWRTGYAALKWQAISGERRLWIIYSYSNCCLFCVWRFFGPELACSGGMGGRDIWSILCSGETACTGVCLWARCLAYFFFLLYMF